MTVRPFGDLEAGIMRLIWAADGPLSVQQLTDSLGPGRSLAYTTVMTVTERLRGKGWLERVKQGRSYRYSALRSSDEYTARLMEQALDASADRETALLRFAERLDATEAAALRAALTAQSGPDRRAEG
jgi:predicted transcriptional regulator